MTEKKAADAMTSAIAVIGMAGRFAGAPNSLQELWANLCNGVESIRFLTEEELAAAGVSKTAALRGDYVPAGGVLDGHDRFDAEFFGFNPREAEVMDPQQRLFLECAWEALENAGYNPDGYKGFIGVWAGSSMNTYVFNLYDNRKVHLQITGTQAMLGNDKDYLATRVSYKLGLRGPGITVQTACSTSLVAIHMAAQALLSGECDMALAGGSSVRVPHAGYLFEEGGILSPDGHCRAFDIDGRGFVPGGGAGVVVLKRLEDALADGDPIDAVIRGSAINNDGATKLGFTAPSIEGQAEVIEQAMAIAGVHPDTIGYVETHGTATALGDPVEIAALTRAFRAYTGRKGYCAIGSIKTNIGHAAAAAGVAGFIKTVLSLKHRMIPPSLHFKTPNPEANLPESPFYVASKLAEWKKGSEPRRAGVSSFGIGGTNAHVILEEAPLAGSASSATDSSSRRSHQLLVLSARTKVALEKKTGDLADDLRRDSSRNLADIAYTLQVGRKAFPHRRVVVSTDVESAITALMSPGVRTSFDEPRHRPIAFVLSASPLPAARDIRDLHDSESTFREELDRCAELVRSFDLRSALFDGAALEGLALNLASFAFQYALTRLWSSWVGSPEGMIGTGVGEHVAAVVADVMPLANALDLLEQNIAPESLGAPRIALLSSLTGRWLTPAEATDARYWTRRPSDGNASLADGLTELLRDPARLVLHIGSGSLRSDARVVAALGRGADEPVSAQLLSALGELWLAGAHINWAGLHAGAPRRRQHLPTYPLDRQRYWIDRDDRDSERDSDRHSHDDTDGADIERHPRPHLSVDYAAPRHILEESVAEVWQGVLGIDRVGIHDNFLDLGGHSLLATQLISRLRETLNFPFPIEALYKAPTVGGMTDFMILKLTEQADQVTLAQSLEAAERSF